MQLKIAIIIPIYNAEKTLERCLDSVFSQKYIAFDTIYNKSYSKQNMEGDL